MDIWNLWEVGWRNAVVLTANLFWKLNKLFVEPYNPLLLWSFEYAQNENIVLAFQQKQNDWSPTVRYGANNGQPLQFLGLFYLNDSQNKRQLGPYHVYRSAQHHAYWVALSYLGMSHCISTDVRTSASFLAEISVRSPRKYLFSVSRKIFSASKYPKKCCM